ncbi:MAG TPA: Xaa-Pro peptidase family protein [Ignavibacteriaceae bacterium]
MNKEILKEKIEQAVKILNEKELDMWLVFVRESSTIHDPSLDMIVSGNWTWQSAFIINRDGDTTAIVGSLEEDNIRRVGTFKNVITYVKSIRESLVDYLKMKKPSSIAINYSKNSVLADGITYGMYNILKEHLQGTGFENRLVSSEDIIASLRGRKSATELAIMREAVKETIKIFDETRKFIKPGVTEIEIADFMKKKVKERGYGLAWEDDHCPAVFTGPDAGGAHSGPTSNKVQKGHIVNIDFGIEYKGYCSDLQRMWYVLKDGEKNAPAEVQKGFDIIRDAIQKVADALKPGVTGCDMDDIARNYITEKGYEEYPHGLGHQVGRNVHDGGTGLFPRWERYGDTPYMKVEEGQIFTIEPRLPVKEYGVSTLEEEVVITRKGCEFISPPQKELMYIK